MSASKELDESTITLKILEFFGGGDSIYQRSDVLAKTLSKEFKMNRTFIFSFEETRHLFRMIGSYPTDERKGKFKLKLDESDVLKECFERKDIKNVSLQNLSPSEPISKIVEEQRGSMILIPMINSSGIIGLTILLSQDKEDMSEESIEELKELFYGISHIMEMMIEHKMLIDANKKLSASEKLAKTISEAKGIDELYKESLKILKEIFEAEIAMIWLHEGDRLRFAFKEGIDEKGIMQKEILDGHGLIGIAAQNKSSLLYTGKDTEVQPTQDIITPKVKSAIVAPLLDGDRVIGVILLANKAESSDYRPYKHFDSFDEALLNDMANRISLNVKIEKLYEELKKENTRLKRLRKEEEERVNQLSILNEVNEAMRSVYSSTELMKVMLTGITAGKGLGYNRALLLLKENDTHFRGTMWVGPAEGEDVTHIWTEVDMESGKFKRLSDFLRSEASRVNMDSPLNLRARELQLDYEKNEVIKRAVENKEVIHVKPEMVKRESGKYSYFVNILHIDEFVIFPLVARYDTVGLVVVDNYITRQPFTNINVEILRLFSTQAGLAIEAIRNYDSLKSKKAQLESRNEYIRYLKEFNENIVEGVNIAIIVLDETHMIKFWNKEAERIFNKKRSSTLNAKFEEALPSLSDITPLVDKVLTLKEPIELNEYSIQRRDEDRIFLDVKVTPLWNKNRTDISGIILIIADITNEKKLQEEFRRQEKLAVLGEMTARVAHEIRNPLSVIGGFANRLLEKNSCPDNKKYLEIISSEVKRLERVVNEALMVAKGGTAVGGKFEYVDLNDVIKYVINLYTDKFEERSVRPEIILEGKKMTLMNAEAIKECIINLVQNSLEAVEIGGVIRVESFEDERNVGFSIWNTGKIISPEVEEKIFAPFYTTKVYGTGLGLSIVRRIIEDEHNGKIEVESKVGRGTKFVIKFPKKGGPENG
ncbi:MAG: hypothetical protein DRP50_01990 [Thermotoga sp.]|nr:MAG: hypothetical protein DRP50_01990 [Thermotoga sp.]